LGDLRECVLSTRLGMGVLCIHGKTQNEGKDAHQKLPVSATNAKNDNGNSS
jgi:hypothetical protein